jgi:hypothetical protein
VEEVLSQHICGWMTENDPTAKVNIAMDSPAKRNLKEDKEPKEGFIIEIVSDEHNVRAVKHGFQTDLSRSQRMLLLSLGER